MITAAQLRAARVLLGIDQKTLAGMAGLSVPTVQRMEASRGNVRGVIDSLTRIIEALDRAGIELILEGMQSNARGERCPPEKRGRDCVDDDMAVERWGG